MRKVPYLTKPTRQQQQIPIKINAAQAVPNPYTRDKLTDALRVPERQPPYLISVVRKLPPAHQIRLNPTASQTQSRS